MTNNQPVATPPANGAAPTVSNESGQPNPSVQTPPATPGQTGTVPDGHIAVPADELARLKRDAARTASLQRRLAINPPRTPAGQPPVNQDDPIAVENARLAAENAEWQTKYHRESVTNKVREMLAKPEFAKLPESTKNLILKNPSVLSEADNVEEALLDIEDFVRDEVSKIQVPITTPNNNTPGGVNPPGVETPPTQGSAPANAAAEQLEDLSNLKGPARSRAAFRNAVKKAKGVK